MGSTKSMSRPSKGGSKGSSKGPPKRTGAKPTGSSSSYSKDKPGKPTIKRAAVQKKPKPASAAPARKKRRVYTEKELGIPKLNMITPAGVAKPKGKKIGKVFVDDQESMMTILAMVNADKEGQIESKILKQRQLEEIRQARQKEMEAKQNFKKEKFEDTKNSLRKGSKNKKGAEDEDDGQSEIKAAQAAAKPLKQKKRVSFGGAR